jgi:chemotaxis protein MotB
MHRRTLLLSGLAATASGCVPVYRKDDLVNKLDREVIALNQENDRLRASLATCATEERIPEIYTELKQVMGTFEVEVRREGDRTIVVVPGTIAFAPGSVRLRAEVDPVLDLLSTALNLHPRLPVVVIGHTDDEAIKGRLKKQYPTNWELSAARAAAVCTSLSSEWGVSPDRFTAAGRGEWHPIADNATAEGREANRRVELVIHPAKD